MSVEIICDVGANWRVSPEEPLGLGLERVYRFAEMIADAGADVLKMQYLRRTVYPEGSAEAALVAGYEWPVEWLPELREVCKRHGLEFLCTVYEPEHVPILDPFVRRWKIASFEVGHLALLEAVAGTQKPVILSTGMTTWIEGRRRARMAGIAAKRLTPLHCVSAYPALPEQMNLACLQYLPIPSYGLSDHTAGSSATAAVMAVALGATVIERHVTMDDVLTGPDNGPWASNQYDLPMYVFRIREAEKMLGDGRKRAMPGEWTEYRYDPQTGKRGVRRV